MNLSERGPMLRHRLAGILAALVVAIAVTSPVAASTQCGSYEHHFSWENDITVNGTSSFKSGQFYLQGQGCWDGSTSYGTASVYSGPTGWIPTIVSGPGYYAYGGGTTDFWINLKSTTSLSGHWCQINMFPRIKLSKSGVWSLTGTSHTESQDSIFTDCFLNLLN